MEQYLTLTDHALWEVIVNDDLVASVASASTKGHIPPKTTEQKLARKNKLKAKRTLMLAIPDEYLPKFYSCKDAKSLWEAIKNRFGGNKESKKMQKTILKENYENFVASSQKGLDKTYDRFQKLISQLEIHDEVISQDDVNLKLLRSLTSAWNNIALIMRNKSDLDTLSMDFTIETVNAAHSVSAASSKNQASTASYADDAKEELTNFALMAFTCQGLSSSSSSDSELENALKEKEDLKLKLEKFETSSKNLTKLINSQMSAIDKTGLGYDGHVNESEVLNNVVDSCESDGDDNQVNDKFKKCEGYHEVLPPYTGNYMPPRADLSFAGLDNSVFKSKVSETITSVPKIETSASKTSKDSLKKPKTVRSRLIFDVPSFRAFLISTTSIH
nr:hypothetical protein [Tanacetum cinerariifolium]